MSSVFFTWRNFDKNSLKDEDFHANRIVKSRFYVVGLVLFLVVNNFLMYFYSKGAFPVDYIFFYLHVFFALHIICAVLFLPYPPNVYGFNFNKPKRSFRMIFFVGIILVTTAISVRVYLIYKGHDQFKIHQFLLTRDAYKYVTYYPLSALLQEAVTKGFFQSFFFSLFSDSQPRFKRVLAIGCSSLLFAQCHLALGLVVYLASLVLSIILGYVYEDSRSLFAVTVLHYLTGVTLFFLTNTV